MVSNVLFYKTRLSNFNFNFVCRRYAEATDDIANKIFPDAKSVDEARAKILEVQQENTKAMLEQLTNEVGRVPAKRAFDPRLLKGCLVSTFKLVERG